MRENQFPRHVQFYKVVEGGLKLEDDEEGIRG